MRMADVYRPPAPLAGAGGSGSTYVPDPGVQDPGGGPNRAQEAANARLAARVAALRANPLFKKSSTPITFPQGYDPRIMDMMIGMSGQNTSLVNNPNLPAMFRPTRG